MPTTNRPSGKRLQISKANTTMVAVVAVASFVTMFSLVAAKALWDQRSFQARVITDKEVARNQLKTNVAAVDSLVILLPSICRNA